MGRVPFVLQGLIASQGFVLAMVVALVARNVVAPRANAPRIHMGLNDEPRDAGPRANYIWMKTLAT